MVASLQSSRRDAGIDIARGIAIIIMMGANMGPVLHEPHSLFMRMCSSLAAPIFVLLAGMMIAHHAGTRSWLKIWKRVGRLLLWAAFTDMAAWGIRPFLAVDVLYLVAIGTAVTYSLRNVPAAPLGAIIMAIAFATPFLQESLGYTAYPTGMELLSGNVTVAVEQQTPVWHHYLIDGWFPVFPWLAYMLAGLMLGRYRWGNSSTHSLTGRKWGILVTGCLAIGGVMWWFHPGAMYDRQGFSELFYPPTVGYFVASLGAVLAVLTLAGISPTSRYWRPVRFMGQHSLFLYVAHSIVIGRFFVKWWHNAPLDQEPFLLVYSLFLLSMFMVTAAMQYAISKMKAV
jgi:uncharacterized membrane protein